jgi:hypothetical protein
MGDEEIKAVPNGKVGCKVLLASAKISLHFDKV